MDGWMNEIDSNREHDRKRGLTAPVNHREHSCVT